MTRFIRNKKGQVAIFVALMFQVLFLFFAMIVNVGLLVHHKINLQNSVDLAAYYGAAKQAEVLNAMAHVNYQIRQSWKLLVWRQRVLGTAGIDPMDARFPYAKLKAGNVTLRDDMMAGGPMPPAGTSPDFTSVFQRPTFCIAYAPHEILASSGNSSTLENSCRYMYQTTFTGLPRANLLYIPSFLSFGSQVAAAITSAATQAINRCAQAGALNYIIGGEFVAAHNRDADERAYLLNYLATGLSQSENNFYEISGDEVQVGLEKTLKKNLTEANNNSLSYEIYNSMGSASCANQIDVEGNKVPSWVSPIYTYPIWRYTDCDSNKDPSRATIQFTSKQLVSVSSQKPALSSLAPSSYRDAISALDGPLTAHRTLVGFEKDPWCVPYIAVHATAKPKIPFMPLSEVEITAEAYAKPFGGRMGPWYVKDWPQGVSGEARQNYKVNAQLPDQVESIGATRVTDLTGIANLEDPAWAANVARFPGDKMGFASEKVLAYFHRALIEPGVNPGLHPNSYENLNIPAQTYPFPVSPDTKESLRYYQNVSAPYVPGGALDSLTWDDTSNMAPRLRLMEIAALAPTIYDLTYYSIDPDFYDNYYVPLEKQIKSGKRPGWDNKRFLLGDYGWRANDHKAMKMNVIDQIKIQRGVGAEKALNSDQSMPYVVKNSMHLLNSWAVDSLLDYRTNSVKFGKCFSPGASTFETPLNPPTPGNCVDGGNVGYSVKLVSKQWLESKDLQLGGEGVPGAAIRNPPPW